MSDTEHNQRLTTSTTTSSQIDRASHRAPGWAKTYITNIFLFFKLYSMNIFSFHTGYHRYFTDKTRKRRKRDNYFISVEGFRYFFFQKDHWCWKPSFLTDRASNFRKSYQLGWQLSSLKSEILSNFLSLKLEILCNFHRFCLILMVSYIWA